MLINYYQHMARKKLGLQRVLRHFLDDASSLTYQNYFHCYFLSNTSQKTKWKTNQDNQATRVKRTIEQKFLHTPEHVRLKLTPLSRQQKARDRVREETSG